MMLCPPHLWPFLFSRKSWYASSWLHRIPSVTDLHLRRMEASDKRTGAAFPLLISGTLLVSQKPQGEVWLRLWTANAAFAAVGGEIKALSLGLDSILGEIAWNVNELCRTTSAFVFLVPRVCGKQQRNGLYFQPTFLAHQLQKKAKQTKKK